MRERFAGTTSSETTSHMSASNPQPLKNLRVINFGWIWAAPALSSALAEMGAEVIKVETGRRVDNTRRSGANFRDVPLHTHSSLTLLRGQKSITLDLGNKESAEIAHALLATADIAVENYRPGTVARWGLDYESVRKARPDIIMISLSAGGQTGPLSKISTFGSTLSCLTGLDSLQGYVDGPPQGFGTAHIDPLNAYFGLIAVMAALRHRERTGEGQYIDLGQWESTSTMFGSQSLDYQWNGRVQGPMGNRDAAMAPHGVYPSLGDDAWVSIAIETEEQWRSFTKALGKPSWSKRPHFADMYRRLRHQTDLDAHVSDWTRLRTAADASTLLQQAGVPAFPVFSDADAFTDPHYVGRDAWVEVEEPFGPLTVYGIPWKLSETPGRVKKAPPLLGQDNHYVYQELLAMRQEHVLTLEQGGAIA